MLDRRETKEDDLDLCIVQVTAIREVADASPLPRRGPHSPFIYLRPSRAIHKCVPHRRVTDLSKATVAEAKVAAFGLSRNGRGGRAVRTSAASSGTKSCFGKSACRAPRLLGSVWA